MGTAPHARDQARHDPATSSPFDHLTRMAPARYRVRETCVILVAVMVE